MERTVPVSLSLTVGGLRGCFLKGSVVGHVSEITGSDCGVESHPSGTLGVSPPPPEPLLHTMVYYSAIIRKQPFIQATAWMMLNSGELL